MDVFGSSGGDHVSWGVAALANARADDDLEDALVVVHAQVLIFRNNLTAEIGV